MVENEYLTDAFTREALSFIKRNTDKPFFLYVPYNAVHSPLQAADAYMERFAHIEDIQRRIFAAMLSNLDDGVGSILETLKREGLEKDTLIFFISDNGGPTAELTSSNGPLRSGKGSVYEGGNRVPFLVSWKGVVPANRVYEHPVLSLDIFATAVSVAHAKIDSNKIYDGVDLIPYLTGKDNSRPHDTLYWRMGSKAAIRVDDWKLVRNPGRNSSDRWELYNLSNDIGESRDLANALPEKRASLIERWNQVDREMIEPVWP